ncbi:MAG TPA: MraY family glycosyltransferase, partial [Candidatus Limnocylindrales bacterium]|nr:MraY family glycosyltransferase [Candidatus Limnocylindrales bacterium]
MSWSPAAGAAAPAIIVAFVVAGLIALGITPVVRGVIHRRGMLDRPDERRFHRRPLPRGGGIAVVIAFVVVGGGLTFLNAGVTGIPGTPGVGALQVWGLFAGAIVAAVIGVIDDALDLRARYQLIGQVVVALIAVASGISVAFIGNPLPFGPNNFTLSASVGAAFTVVWIVGMTNSLNFIDGLDGLSTGIALIAAVTLGLTSLTTQVTALGEPFVALLCFAFAGALLGFLRWNFHPAVIFQGTAGVMVLGYVLGVLAILGTAKIIVAMLVL